MNSEKCLNCAHEQIISNENKHCDDMGNYTICEKCDSSYDLKENKVSTFKIKQIKDNCIPTYDIYDRQRKEYTERKVEKKEVIEKAFNLISDRVKHLEDEYSDELNKIISRGSDAMGVIEAMEILEEWDYKVTQYITIPKEWLR